MARRWVRFEMPVMVCVEVDEQVEDARVVTVVAGTDEQDITLDRDLRREVLVYDESMERVAASEPLAAEAIAVAEDRGDWPALTAWEFGPDAFRDPWLYVDNEDDPEGAGGGAELAGDEQSVSARHDHR
ncbi:hypothetical protein [Actinocrispum wychmicini]|uniref:Uncharacterized protein n=1 Tax=Actinocrispum wychmicini TaxID=1213861 RepID=A0A4R2JPP8_9PSEU|nr:hypothetical protein [Actinocrispum wychmicini]TCO60752.1 hypothetical protein EV192_103327 [Actinocrispum wychmicini]